MAYGYGGYGNYNPLQGRIDNLMQQKQMIESQLQSLQQMGNMPPVTINNNMTQPQAVGNFDFNGKWVDNEEQAKQIMTSNLPLIAFDNNSPIFYMKGSDGNFRKYRFEEVIEPVSNSDPQMESRMSNLENKLDELITALSQPISKQPEANTQVTEKASQNANKQQTRGGTK